MPPRSLVPDPRFWRDGLEVDSLFEKLNEERSQRVAHGNLHDPLCAKERDGAPSTSRTCDLLVRRLMQVPGSVSVARIGTFWCPVFGTTLFTDCSLSGGEVSYRNDRNSVRHSGLNGILRQGNSVPRWPAVMLPRDAGDGRRGTEGPDSRRGLVDAAGPEWRRTAPEGSQIAERHDVLGLPARAWTWPAFRYSMRFSHASVLDF